MIKKFSYLFIIINILILPKNSCYNPPFVSILRILI